MKTLPLLMVPVALVCFTSPVGADNSQLERAQLESLLDRADQYGFTHFEEISVEDADRIEFEGWGKDGWRLDVEMTIDDASLIEEARSKRQYQIPEWALSGDQVRSALESAFANDLHRFEQLDVDSTGRIEIEGYDTQNQEIELRLETQDLAVTEVEND